MRKIGTLLTGTGFCVLLGPALTGAIAYLIAPYFPHAIDRGALVGFVYGAAIYLPVGLALIVAGKLLVQRSFGLPSNPHSKAKRIMQYQLALQFRGDALADYNAMVELEQLLSVLLGTTAMVAGHDMGAGEKSIFIHTTNAPSTFLRCKPLLASQRALDGLTAAYRAADGKDYQVLWPKQFQGAFALA
jgi:hypothetical protein